MGGWARGTVRRCRERPCARCRGYLLPAACCPCVSATDRLPTLLAVRRMEALTLLRQSVVDKKPVQVDADGVYHMGGKTFPGDTVLPYKRKRENFGVVFLLQTESSLPFFRAANDHGAAFEAIVMQSALHGGMHGHKTYVGALDGLLSVGGWVYYYDIIYIETTTTHDDQYSTVFISDPPPPPLLLATRNFSNRQPHSPPPHRVKHNY